MSVNISINVRSRDQAYSAYDDPTRAEKQKQEKSNSIFAGDLNTKADKIQMKKEMAQKQALKRILDQFTSDSKIDEMIASGEEAIDQLGEQIIQENKELKNLNAKQEELQNMYQTEAKSQEQKDLDLLRKQRDVLSGKSGDVLTQEEQQRLSEMGPMTDYQIDSLQNDILIERSQKKIESAQASMHNNRKGITDIKIEVAKVHFMVDEQNLADKIIKSASKEVIGMLQQEAVDHIDEVREEEKEQAEEIKEEQEETKEVTREEVVAEKLNEVVESAQSGDPLKKALTKFMEESNMTLEELKGIAVDQVV